MTELSKERCRCKESFYWNLTQPYFQFEEDLAEKCKKNDAVKFFYKALMEELHTPTISLKKEKIELDNKNQDIKS